VLVVVDGSLLTRRSKGATVQGDQSGTCSPPGRIVVTSFCVAMAPVPT